MADVFISHGAADLPLAEFLHWHLLQEGLSVYLASVSMPPGERWMPHIMENCGEQREKNGGMRAWNGNFRRGCSRGQGAKPRQHWGNGQKNPNRIRVGISHYGGGGGSRTRVRRRLTPGTTCLAHRLSSPLRSTACEAHPKTNLLIFCKALTSGGAKRSCDR